jgi:hypothetical protein
VAVVIDEMHSTVEAQPATGGAAGGAGGEGGDKLDEESLRGKYRAVLREIVREELERYLRGAAD